MSEASRQREKIRDAKKFKEPEIKFSDGKNTTSNLSPDLLSIMMMYGVFEHGLIKKRR